MRDGLMKITFGTLICKSVIQAFHINKILEKRPGVDFFLADFFAKR